MQRSLGIGYGRAARLIDFMAEDGIVGQYNGSQAREVIISLEQWAEMSGSGTVKPVPAEPPKRTNTILLAPPAERRTTEPSADSAVSVARDDQEPDDQDEDADDEDDLDEEDDDFEDEDEDEDGDDEDEDEYDRADGEPSDAKPEVKVKAGADSSGVPQRGCA